MKRILFILIACIVLSFGKLFAQDVPEIESAFLKANISIMSDQLSSSVDLILPSDDRTVSKEECVTVVTQFLRSVAPKEFSILHEGSRGDSKFLVGALKAAKGCYRVHFLLKKVSNQFLISQLRIEPSNE